MQIVFSTLLISVIPFTQLDIGNALQLLDKGVCNYNENNDLKCCPGYYEDNLTNKCKECPIGTFGKSCEEHCSNNFYGLGCLLQCNCSAEMCNRERGCQKTETERKKKRNGITEDVVIACVVSVILLVGIVSCVIVWKRYDVISYLPKKNIFRKQRTFFNSQPKEEEANEDHYSEIRESMMVRPMTAYGRHLSVIRTTYVDPLDQYHHLDLKSSVRPQVLNEELMGENKDEYIEPIDVPVKRSRENIYEPLGKKSSDKYTSLIDDEQSQCVIEMYTAEKSTDNCLITNEQQLKSGDDKYQSNECIRDQDLSNISKKELITADSTDDNAIKISIMVGKKEFHIDLKANTEQSQSETTERTIKCEHIKH